MAQDFPYSTNQASIATSPQSIYVLYLDKHTENSKIAVVLPNYSFILFFCILAEVRHGGRGRPSSKNVKTKKVHFARNVVALYAIYLYIFFYIFFHIFYIYFFFDVILYYSPKIWSVFQLI